MPIVIEVTAPTGAARTELAAAKKAVDEVTAATKAQGDAAEKAGRQGSTSAQKQKSDLLALGSALKGAGNAFSSLVDEMTRQQRILDSIEGPMHQHLQDLRSLEQLYKRGSISAGEFSAAQNRMMADLDAARNKRLGLKAPAAATSESGGIGDAVSGLGSAGGPLGEIMGSITTGAAVQAGAVIGLVAAIVSLHDSYVELHNQALRIAGTNGDVNGTLNRQLVLADELHASLSTTIGLTAKVKEGTDDFNLTQRQTAQLTKEIGQAVELSGHPLEDAAGVMDRLSYAFESGTITGRELKGMMREFPEIGDVLSRSMLRSRKDLVDMANQGKITAQQIINAFDKAGPDLEKKFGARVETVGEKLKHLKDEVTVYVGQGGSLDAGTMVANTMSPSEAIMNASKSAARLTGFGGLFGGGGSGEASPAAGADDYAEKLARAYGADVQFSEQLAKVNKLLQDQSGFFKGLSDAVDENVAKINSAYYKENTAIAMVVANLTAMNTVLGKAKPDQITGVVKSFGEDTTKDLRGLQDATVGVTKETRIYGAEVETARTKTNEHKRGIADITQAYKEGAVSSKEYTDRMRELSEEFAFSYNLIHGIIQPAKEWNLSVDALNGAVAHGTISLIQYNEALGKLNAQPVDQTKLAALREAFGLPMARTPGFVGPKSFGGIDFAVGIDNSQAKASEEAKGFGDSFTYLQQTGAPWAQLVAQIEAKQAKFAEIMGDSRTSVEKYRDELKILNDENARQYATDDERALALQNLKDKYTTIRTPAEQYALAVKKIDEEQQIVKGSTEAYDKAMRDARISMNTGDIADGFAKGLDDINKSIDVAASSAKILTDAFEGTLNAINELVTKGTTDFHALTESILSDFLRLTENQILRALIGSAFGGGGGNAIGVAKDLTSPGGLWGFATGGSFTVGGGGGTDQTPVHFMATRGERVTIQTPEQQKQSAGAGATSVRVINVSNTREQTLATLNTREGEALIMNGVIGNRRTLRGHILK